MAQMTHDGADGRRWRYAVDVRALLTTLLVGCSASSPFQPDADGAAGASGSSAHAGTAGRASAASGKAGAPAAGAGGLETGGGGQGALVAGDGGMASSAGTSGSVSAGGSASGEAGSPTACAAPSVANDPPGGQGCLFFFAGDGRCATACGEGFAQHICAAGSAPLPQAGPCFLGLKDTGGNPAVCCERPSCLRTQEACGEGRIAWVCPQDVKPPHPAADCVSGSPANKWCCGLPAREPPQVRRLF